jgi:small subunit ribosomal protein S16
MLKIRLCRMGSRHRPFYRLVVSESRQVPTAAALDEVGYYDPRREPVALSVDLAKVDSWTAKGAQPSPTVKKLIQRARAGAQSPYAAAVAPKKAAKLSAAATAAAEASA